jgi:hypothetical protein
MHRTKALAATCVLVAALGSAGSAQAGPPGKWTKVTSPNTNIDEVSLARTADGVLHVGWTRQQGLGGEVLHSAISRDAKTVSGPDAILSYPGGVNRSPLMLTAPDGGLRAFFGGLFSGSPLDGRLATATSSDGKAWTVAPAPASNGTQGGDSAVYAAAGIGGAFGKDGSPITAWGDSAPGEGGYHFGLDPNGPDLRFGGGCCVYDPNVGVDSVTGQAVLAWKFLTDSNGTAARAIAPTGSQVTLPGAGAADTGSRTGITGRLGAPGVYIAYQRGDNQFLSRPAVIRFGASTSLVLEGKRGARMVGISPGPQGRLWVFWERAGRIYGRRSNEEATAFGATVSVVTPGAGDVSGLAGDGRLGGLDVVALIDVGGYGNWHQRLLPGLTLKAKSGKGAVTLTVRDAGDPVKNAKVKVGGESAKTNADGKVTIALKPGRYVAKASKKGYAKAKRRTRSR